MLLISKLTAGCCTVRTCHFNTLESNRLIIIMHLLLLLPLLTVIYRRALGSEHLCKRMRDEGPLFSWGPTYLQAYVSACPRR